MALVAAVGAPGSSSRGSLLSGFVDLQADGFAGVDFATADAAAHGPRRRGPAPRRA